MEKTIKDRLSEQRVLSLVELINYKYGGNSAKLSKELGISRTIVRGWISFEKTLGARAAESIENKLHIPSRALQRALLGFFEPWVASGEPSVINQPVGTLAHPIIDVLDGLLILRHPAINEKNPRISQLISMMERFLIEPKESEDNFEVSVQIQKI